MSSARRASSALRAEMSRMMPVKKRLPPLSRHSAIERSRGTSEPSLRRPSTSRPTPMIFRSPVRRYAARYPSCRPVCSALINTDTFRPTTSSTP